MKTTLLAAIVAACTAAQTPNDAPALIRLVRSDSRGIDTRLIQPYANSKAAAAVVGMISVSGLSETWLMEMHDSFASIEDLDKALSAVTPVRTATDRPESPDDLLAPSRTLIGLYRPALSYRPDQTIRILQRARYFYVSIYHIRPGAESDFGEVVRQRRATLDNINLDRPDIAYQIMSGASSGMYVFLAPLISLKVMDEGLARMPARGEGAGSKAPQSEIGREHLLFRVEPRISYVSDDFASADPEFWHPKPKQQ